MTPFLNRTERVAADVASHAHLLKAEMQGQGAKESPEAVMAEIEFRATQMSSLMEAMFKEALDQDEWDEDET